MDDGSSGIETATLDETVDPSVLDADWMSSVETSVEDSLDETPESVDGWLDALTSEEEDTSVTFSVSSGLSVPSGLSVSAPEEVGVWVTSESVT